VARVVGCETQPLLLAFTHGQVEVDFVVQVAVERAAVDQGFEPQPGFRAPCGHIRPP
jgi:hypothetical protein